MGQYHMGQYDPDGKEQNPEIETDIAKAEFPFIWGISATVMTMCLFRVACCCGCFSFFPWQKHRPFWGEYTHLVVMSLVILMLHHESWKLFPMTVCVDVPVSTKENRKRGHTAAGEPKIPLETSGLSNGVWLLHQKPRKRQAATWLLNGPWSLSVCGHHSVSERSWATRCIAAPFPSEIIAGEFGSSHI